MDATGDVEFAEDFCEVVGGLTASLARYQWQSRAFDYVKGLLLAGHRKSIEGISVALGLPHCQGLHHFISNASWDASVVMADLARAAEAVIDPAWWIVDDTGFRKCGKHSAGVARQYTGTAGDVKNCQIGVSLQLARHEASSPIGWRLFLPESWDPASPKAGADITERRRRAKVPTRAPAR
ncbi:transposase [Glycomyces sp. L485]|uniref:IS701 family transposase n=1 Tax=Glycomyces sp. L485 TaxID=2909235 RepID=UPI001F4AB660|nr:transposase [Glycomyces sp. L485]MCH7232148.1 transposase [Glycomyces sp. L485]